ncbi:IclR family transcriptional regulator [Halopelagius longus]|nr:IclR family transcriptional regulator [Halopelagius longus]SDR08122.1 transcriptional regulator, IclR family [Halopelagius longus]
MTADDPTTLQSSEKSFAILGALVELGEAGVTELAEYTSYHKSTVYVHLRTLQELAFVTKSGDRYRLTFKLVEYGERIKRGTDAYVNGRDEVDALAEKTGELASLVVPEGERVVVAYSKRGEKVARDFTPEVTVPMRSTAAGKAILAYLPDGRDAEAASTGAHVDAEAADLGEIRRDGFAVTDDRTGANASSVAPPLRKSSRAESRRVPVDVRSVAAPVLRGGAPVGAVSITGPTKRIEGQYLNDVQRQVVATAERIETKLRYE